MCRDYEPIEERRKHSERRSGVEPRSIGAVAAISRRLVLIQDNRRAEAGGGLVTLSALPVLSKDLAAPDVVIAAVAEGFLALDPGLRVAGLHERAPARLVLQIHARADLVQVELAEAIARPEGDRLRRDAPPPERLLADDDAALAVPVAPVDAANAGPSNRTAVDFDNPADRVCLLSH